ncbi:hypothetical protein GCM10022419_100130 [Nonomuraea rosea]|uniref:Uncharacterized protein n=1 Tax=Nonomuraea rosea TaxID=638574 RepID=A0ABP6Z7C8_9ACTN
MAEDVAGQLGRAGTESLSAEAENAAPGDEAAALIAWRDRRTVHRTAEEEEIISPRCGQKLRGSPSTWVAR